ncbi:MAG TPA: hypothetical protein VNO22_02255 [Planctomycetota bacterium]|nr:hypothetical protein [Planctomycetota bacterium]
MNAATRAKRGKVRKTSEARPVPDVLDFYDGLVVELDRLRALAELLGCAGERLDPRVLGGVACLLEDVERRMREALRGLWEGRKRKG